MIAKDLLTTDLKSLSTKTGINCETEMIRRFATPEKLVSYAGLAPSQRNSGDTNKTVNITLQMTNSELISFVSYLLKNINV